MQPLHKVVVACDGNEGVEKAIELVPDLIISDVMMPGKDGFEVCGILKSDERTSHIPIIILTAKTDQDSKLLGLRQGADAYLSKPFSEDELLVRMQKLLELRKELQRKYSSLLQNEIQSPSSKEDTFLIRAKEIVQENLSNEKFDVLHFLRALGMSRTQLRNKLKALTDKSTTEFISSIRLQRAHELLKSSELNITQIAYEVGFKDPSYFTKLYSEKYGHPPSRTRK